MEFDTVYFFGLFLGFWFCQRFIAHVGHIRAYAIFTSIIAMASLLAYFYRRGFGLFYVLHADMPWPGCLLLLKAGL